MAKAHHPRIFRQAAPPIIQHPAEEIEGLTLMYPVRAGCVFEMADQSLDLSPLAKAEHIVVIAAFVRPPGRRFLGGIAMKSEKIDPFFDGTAVEKKKARKIGWHATSCFLITPTHTSKDRAIHSAPRK